MLRLRLLAAVLCLAALLPAQGDVAAQLDRIASSYQKERGFMGAVLVARGGSVLLEKGYGMANLEWSNPNTPATKFRLGSITKQFTSALVLQLVEQGRIALDDPIAKYFPDLPEAWRPVTIHQLLNHTSGIVSYTGLPEFRSPKMRRVPLSPMEIVLLTRDKPLDYPPGEGYKYNNTGYVFLGALIEKVTGEKFDAVLKKRIFDPLEMKDSGYDWTRPVLPKRASGYTFDRVKKEYRNADFLDMSLPHAAGSLYSTVGDLYRWDRALCGDKVLKKESLAKAYTPGRNNYGYGWVIEKRYGETRMGHGGGINGFSTMILRYPGKDAVVIVLSNVENGEASAVAERLSAALLGQPVELPWEKKDVPVGPEILSRWAGEYQLPPLKITVTVEDGKLMIQPAGQPKVQAFGESETRFFLKVVDAQIEFVPGEGGKAAELILRQGGQELRGKRIAP